MALARMTKKRAEEIYFILEEMFPDAKAELNFTNPYELLIATILSAQCTDVRVNQVTEVLFKKYPNPEDIANLSQEELEKEIYTCGFYRNKAKNILSATRILLEEYNGVVPETIEELVKLPGVGKKTANVVASCAFGVPAIAVDTHVFRTSNRLGLANADTVEKTEAQLEKIWPKEFWSKGHHLLIFLGRRVCKSRKPLCEECNLSMECKYYTKEKK
ncbi:endonuclease III [Peptoniphilus sp. KCTC 25270]|uniref:endonuclease III n=1 Tax=Peptoniphilus sp. KCTC 25270 TaxID=2897414 RepID=UPI001E2828F2|nr:endonuclease III [Peptoniphilus sp. KCTC 25270]MCD1146640.1 endonuclease III [Peptoniphilus sp. KCTC 25270]